MRGMLRRSGMGPRLGRNLIASAHLLRGSGVPLAEARSATEGILRGDAISVTLPEGAKVSEICRRLDDLGVIR